jgi:hypothetical protein
LAEKNGFSAFACRKDERNVQNALKDSKPTTNPVIHTYTRYKIYIVDESVRMEACRQTNNELDDKMQISDNKSGQSIITMVANYSISSSFATDFDSNRHKS